MAVYSTPQLYDIGEEGWDLKLHVECGPVYLEGYKNIAPAGLHPYERPELVEANRADVKDYWDRLPDGNMHVKHTPDPNKTAVDLLSDMRQVPYVDAADKILCMESLAGLTLTAAKQALLNWWNALKVGGVLIISVPDPAETRKVLEFWTGLDVYGLRHAFYTEENLRGLLRSHGFSEIERLEGVHFYPSILLRAVKDDPWVSGRSYQQLPPLRGRILGIGPGDFPLEQATEFVDVSDEKADKLGGRPLLLHDLNEELPLVDNLFDFVYCSHVLEHLESPLFGLAEIQRVGRAGFVEVPGILMDFILRQGKTHPKWACWGAGQALLFIEKTEEQRQLFLDWENVWGAFFHHAVHGQRLGSVQRAIRAYFWENIHRLNMMAFWDKDKGLEIVGMEMRISCT